MSIVNKNNDLCALEKCSNKINLVFGIMCNLIKIVMHFFNVAGVLLHC